MGNSKSKSHQKKSGFTLSKVIVLFRHGARAPSEGSLKPFKEATKNSPVSEWDPSEIELLTTVGLKQMENLGKFFRHTYFNTTHKDFLPEDVSKSVVWKSSKINRVIESGQNFWKGFDFPQTDPKPFPDNEDPDNFFRAWNSEPSYLEAVKELKASKEYNDKGVQEEKFLNSLFEKFGMPTEGKTPAEKLGQMTYFWEVLECERYFPSPRTALSSNLTQQEQEKIEELAHWVWNKRFFLPNFGKVIGGKLLNNLKQEILNQEIKFAAYSCHDYSLLSLMAAFGLDHYVDKVLGFASTILLEVWTNAEGTQQFKVLLNNHPYDFKGDKTEIHWKTLELLSSDKMAAILKEN